MNITIGQQAPDFELPDQNGNKHKLSDYKGGWVLLYFYPQDDTSGCTIEACAMRDNLPKFGNINAKVLGISTDTVASHKQFEEKYKLTFTLLADEQKQVLETYGVGSGFFGGAKRVSFLINPQGQIAKIYSDVKPEIHSEEVLKDLELLNK